MKIQPKILEISENREDSLAALQDILETGFGTDCKRKSAIRWLYHRR